MPVKCYFNSNTWISARQFRDYSLKTLKILMPWNILSLHILLSLWDMLQSAFLSLLCLIRQQRNKIKGTKREKKKENNEFKRLHKREERNCVIFGTRNQWLEFLMLRKKIKTSRVSLGKIFMGTVFVTYISNIPHFSWSKLINLTYPFMSWNDK